MPVFVITAPDGNEYEITAPEGSSEQDVLTYAQNNYQGAGSQPQPPARASAPPSGFVKGLRDPLDASAQLLSKVLPDPLVSGVNWLHNKAAQYGLGDPLPAGGIDQQIKQQEQAYQQSRAQAGEAGIDWARLAGNVFNPANVAAASRIPQAASLGGRVAANAMGGAGLAVLGQPAYSDDLWSEKGAQAQLGAVGGGAVPLITGGVARVVAPQIDKGVKALNLEGIKTTVGQRLGGMWKDVEDKLTSVPFTGKTIETARMRGYKEFNDAAINRSLAPIDKKVPGNMESRQAVAYARKELGNAYDGLLSKMSGKIDDQFQGEFDRIVDMVDNGLPEELAKIFRKRINYDTVKRITPYGKMSGESLKAIQESVRKNAEKFSDSQDPFQRDLGDAFGAVLKSFDDMLARNNPKYAAELKKINTGYANFKRVQRAAGGLGADEGLFTPAQLQNAVRALDKSKDKRAFAEGTALMQGLSEKAKATLPNKVPDSGTAGRSLMTNPITGGLGGLFTAPLMPMYSQKGSALMQGLLSSRPPHAQFMADYIRKSTPFLVPAAGQGLFTATK